MSDKLFDSDQQNWRVLVVSGLDAGERERLFAALGAEEPVEQLPTSGIAVSRSREVAFKSIPAELRPQGIRVRLSNFEGDSRAAELAGLELAARLSELDIAIILVLDGVAESMGRHVTVFLEALRPNVVAAVIPVVGIISEELVAAANDAPVPVVGLRPWAEVHGLQVEDVMTAIARNATTLGRSTPTTNMDWHSGDAKRNLAPHELETAPSPLDRSGPQKPVGRHVNSRICHKDSDEDVPPSPGLNRDTDYDLLISIGAFDPRSVLDDVFPDDKLPRGGVWLRVAMRVANSTENPVVGSLYLPETGNSFVCPCQIDTKHTCAEDERGAFLRFPFSTRTSGRTMALEVSVYYHAAVVHVHELVLPIVGASFDPHRMPVAQTARRSIRGETKYALTRSFSDLGHWAGHKLSFMSTDIKRGSSAQVFADGASITPLTYKYNDDAAQEVAARFRESLFDAHLVETESGWKSLYTEGDHRKEQQPFERDLFILAKHGALLFNSIFPESDWVDISPFIKDKSGPAIATLQFVRLETEKLGLPWQQIYDLPMQAMDELEQTYVCPSVSQFGPSGVPWFGEAPSSSSCPHETNHPRSGSVLCPFGFWGLAYMLEAPPDIGRQPSLPHAIFADSTESIITVVAWNPHLPPAEAQRHLGALRDERLGISEPPISDKQELVERLGPSTLDLLYVYCHGERRKPPGANVSDPVLVLGPSPNAFTAGDVMQWIRNWENPHWPNRRPLVILNTCHSGEIRAATLASFVDAFVVTAGAAGVIATEITIEQSVAGMAMENFLKTFRRGRSVGEAMRDMRWCLISRGNVLGFAYSPYCASDLKLRYESIH